MDILSRSYTRSNGRALGLDSAECRQCGFRWILISRIFTLPQKSFCSHIRNVADRHLWSSRGFVRRRGCVVAARNAYLLGIPQNLMRFPRIRFYTGCPRIAHTEMNLPKNSHSKILSFSARESSVYIIKMKTKCAHHHAHFRFVRLKLIYRDKTET